MIHKFILKTLALILTHIVASRLISIPLAVAMFVKWYIAVLLIFTMDIAQVPLFYHLYEQPQKIRFITARLRLWRQRWKRSGYKKKRIIREDRNWQALVLKRAQKFGQWGILLVSAMPSLGGGMWTGVLLAHLLKLDKKRSYLLLSAGSLMSCLLLALGFGGIKTLIVHLVKLLV
ncbi:MAG: small multi-drug export protein [Elusimicrobia bacterium]|nr:small multi-drug export protein [Elusimicrobiota bacterium]